MICSITGLLYFLFLRVIFFELGQLFFRIRVNQNILMVAMLFVFSFIAKKLRKSRQMIFYSMVILGGYFVAKFSLQGADALQYLAQSLKRSLIIIVPFCFLRGMVYFYAEKTMKKTTPFAFWIFVGALLVWIF